MEAMLGISLFSYLYLKLAKPLCLSYYFLCFLLNKIGGQEGGTGSAQKREWGVGVGGVECRGGGVSQIMYTHVSKCKNNQINTAHCHGPSTVLSPKTLITALWAIAPA
jgi:hypothetical protein